MTVSGKCPPPFAPHPCYAASSHILPPPTHDHTEVKATKEEMDKAQIDLSLRDACAHLLIPLNKYVL